MGGEGVIQSSELRDALGAEWAPRMQRIAQGWLIAQKCGERPRVG